MGLGRIAVLALAGAACYAPSVPAGTGADGAEVVDAAGGRPDGPDAPPGPPGDHPDEPVLLELGTGSVVTFLDLAAYTADRPASCELAGRDVFFEIDLPFLQVVYVDTFDSTAHPTLEILRDACAVAGATIHACTGRQCAGEQVQWADNLPSGKSCLHLVDREDGDDALTVRVIAAGKFGPELVNWPGGGISGSTCGMGNAAISAACNSGAAEDVGVFFTTCPAETLTLSATMDVCDPAGRNYALYFRSGSVNSGVEEGCVTDSCGNAPASVMATIDTPGLHWLIVDGASATACGTFMASYMSL